MANQRIFLRCKACGAEKFIAKRLMGAFHTVCTEGWQGEWDEWFEEHHWGFCKPEAELIGDGLDVFELAYEHVDADGNPSGA